MTNLQPFEASLKKLDDLVSQLERGDLPLDKAMTAFEEGNKLVKECQKQLNAAEMKIEKFLTNKVIQHLFQKLKEFEKWLN